MNVTLSIDDEVLARARELAARRGTSLNQLVRDYLEEIASQMAPEEIVRELDELWNATEGDSCGRAWSREELYGDRGVR